MAMKDTLACNLADFISIACSLVEVINIKAGSTIIDFYVRDATPGVDVRKLLTGATLRDLSTALGLTVFELILAPFITQPAPTIPSTKSTKIPSSSNSPQSEDDDVDVVAVAVSVVVVGVFFIAVSVAACAYRFSCLEKKKMMTTHADDLLLTA
ncbi:hypothetical protein T492DRAFT_1045677 [Pavlovales sp. CCMP2436]|nr:hypothetical protein T492DRAFT_1045677 [Pavlovales sp. CCMP2436]